MTHYVYDCSIAMSFPLNDSFKNHRVFLEKKNLYKWLMANLFNSNSSQYNHDYHSHLTLFRLIHLLMHVLHL